MPGDLAFCGPLLEVPYKWRISTRGGGVWDRPIAVQEATLPTTNQSATTTSRVPHLNLPFVSDRSRSMHHVLLLSVRHVDWSDTHTVCTAS